MFRSGLTTFNGCMTVESLTTVITFLATWVALTAAHEAGDQWAQTSAQAAGKARPGWVGRRHCVSHVAAYTACGIVALILVHAIGVPLTAAGCLAALAVSAASHYVADRRAPLWALARALGKGGYLDHVTVQRRPDAAPDVVGPGTAAFHLDQSWHKIWLFASALVAVLPALL